ncbi:MAG TPA: lysophospholipid acyltransferase family protein [Trueperaceae bacterium]|nr:lysophospholipid acyltransferase family protein [Trueperaceae bacterium]
MIAWLDRLVRRKWFYVLAVNAFRTFTRLVYGLRVEDADKVPQDGRGLVVACNHVSAWDPPVVGVSVPREIHFMAKKELFASDWGALLMHGLRAFPVDRSINDIGAVKDALRQLQAGLAIGIFAQGTRNAGDKEALDGAAYLAQRAGVPLQPAAVWRDGRRFHVRFAEPIEPQGKTRDRARAMTRELMLRVNEMLPSRTQHLGTEGAREEPREKVP